MVSKKTFNAIYVLFTTAGYTPVTPFHVVLCVLPAHKIIFFNIKKNTINTEANYSHLTRIVRYVYCSFCPPDFFETFIVRYSYCSLLEDLDFDSFE